MARRTPRSPGHPAAVPVVNAPVRLQCAGLLRLERPVVARVKTVDRCPDIAACARGPLPHPITPVVGHLQVGSACGALPKRMRGRETQFADYVPRSELGDDRDTRVMGVYCLSTALIVSVRVPRLAVRRIPSGVVPVPARAVQLALGGVDATQKAAQAGLFPPPQGLGYAAGACLTHRVATRPATTATAALSAMSWRILTPTAAAARIRNPVCGG
jgi:hypothetical protein